MRAAEQRAALDRLDPVAFRVMCLSFANAIGNEDTLFTRRAAVITGAKALALVSDVYLGKAVLGQVPYVSRLTTAYASALSGAPDTPETLAELVRVPPRDVLRFFQYGVE